MTAGQRRRLDDLVSDYRDNGFSDSQIAGAVRRLAGTFYPVVALTDVDAYLRVKGL